MKEIDSITIENYQDVLPDGIAEWLKFHESYPRDFWSYIVPVSPKITLHEFLKKIRKTLKVIYSGKQDTASSFADSRFTPIGEMIERGMITCGALVNIYGTTLRKMGIPVRYIHGRSERFSKRKDDRHAWLDIYNPINRHYFECDPGHPGFGMWADPTLKRIKVYHNWLELKEDYEKGNF